MQELHVWRARLDSSGWRRAVDLPVTERERAMGMRSGDVRRRWVAARWALRAVLSAYLERDPVAIELRLGEHGKPQLAEPGAALRFNLSHSGELALIAVSLDRDVGVDVQRMRGGRERSADFYAAWTRREAIAKCHGVSLWAPLPDAPVAVAELGADAGYAAAVAVAGESVPAMQRFELAPC